MTNPAPSPWKSKAASPTPAPATVAPALTSPPETELPFAERVKINKAMAAEKVVSGMNDTGTSDALKELQSRIAANPEYPAAQASFDKAIKALRVHVQEGTDTGKPNYNKTPAAQQAAYVRLAAKDPILEACVSDPLMREAIDKQKRVFADGAERAAKSEQQAKVKEGELAVGLNVIDSHFGGAEGQKRSRERTREGLTSDKPHVVEAFTEHAEKYYPDLLRTPSQATSLYIDHTGKDQDYYDANPTAPTIAGSLVPRSFNATSPSTQAEVDSSTYSASPAAETSPEKPKSKLNQDALSADQIKNLSFSDSGPAYIPSFSGQGTMSMPLQINTDRIAPADQKYMSTAIADSGDVKATRQALQEHRDKLETGTAPTMKFYGNSQRYSDLGNENQSLEGAFESGKTTLPYQATFDAYGKKVYEVRETYVTYNPQTKKIETHSNYSPNQQNAIEAVESTVTASRYLQNCLDRLASRYPQAETISATTPEGKAAAGIMSKLSQGEHSQLVAREQYKLSEAKKDGIDYGDSYIRATQNPSTVLTGDKFAKVAKSFTSNELLTDVFGLTEVFVTSENKDQVNLVKNDLQQKIKNLSYSEKLVMAKNFDIIESYYRKNNLNEKADFVKDLGGNELANFETNDKLFREFRKLDSKDPQYQAKLDQLSNAIHAANPNGLNEEFKKGVGEFANTNAKKESLAAFERCISKVQHKEELALFQKFEKLYTAPDRNSTEFKFDKMQLEKSLADYADKNGNLAQIKEAIIASTGRNPGDSLKALDTGLTEIQSGKELSFTKPLSARAKEIFKTWGTDSTEEELTKLKNEIEHLSREEKEQMASLIENEWPKYIRDTDTDRNDRIEKYMGFRDFFNATINE